MRHDFKNWWRENGHLIVTSWSNLKGDELLAKVAEEAWVEADAQRGKEIEILRRANEKLEKSDDTLNDIKTLLA